MSDFPVMIVFMADQTKKYVFFSTTSSYRKSSKLQLNILEGQEEFGFQRFFSIVIVAPSSAIRKLSSCASQFTTILT